MIAKGVEDTALYCDRRMSALAEVGADPGRFGLTVDEFHAFCECLARDWPQSLLASSTHDTKRSEDVRLRIAALSEFADEWAREVRDWRELAEAHRVDGMPDRGTEYLLYQTLVGVWPASVERVATTMLKSAREAKEHTSWIDGDADFERALDRFVRAILADEDFVARVDAFVRRVLPVAREHSLAATLLKLTAPGVPDIYQGCEHWRESLVDPDNRRGVDFAELARLLDDASQRPASEVFDGPHHGLAKLWLTHRVLTTRAAAPSAFAVGSDYEPLAVDGAGAEHTIAFVRGGRAMVVAPRLVRSRPANALDARLTLPPGTWRDALDEGPPLSGEVTVGDLYGTLPVALRIRADATP